MFLLSQDKDQVFVTFPTWSKAYGKAEDDKNFDIDSLTKDDFLLMEEYGPFRMSSAEDVSHVANFLHDYSVLVSGILDQPEK